MCSHISKVSIYLQRFITENFGTVLPEEFPLRVRDGNYGKNRQVQRHRREKSVGEIILAICCPSPTCMKTAHIGYRQVGYSLVQKESVPWFLRQVLAQAAISVEKKLGFGLFFPR